MVKAMPKKMLPAQAIPTLIQERLQAWGRVIRAQRTLQRLRAADLCARLEISEATLRRLERGDAGAGAGLYLMALQVLGVLDELTPSPPAVLWDAQSRQRVRLPAAGSGDDYF
jgi:transcriptional regulator with XRE-family HTH domain